MEILTDPILASAEADELPGSVPPSPKKGKEKPPPPQRKHPTDAAVRDGLVQLYTSIGMGISFVDQEIGLTFGEIAPGAAEAWVHLARESPAVRRALETLVTTGAWGQVLMAHAPLIMVVIERRSHFAPAPKTPTPEAGPSTNGHVPG